MIFLIIAGILVVAGAAIFVIVMSVNGWDFKKLSTARCHTSSYVVKENFDEIIINTIEADVKLLPSEDGKCTVVCYEEEKVKHEVNVKSNTLVIDAKDTRKWYDHINIFSFASPKITVYLPTDKLTSLYINGSTGDMEISNALEFENIDISASTGNVNCFASASGAIKIELSTGDIDVVGISAGELNLSVSTGKINVKSAECSGDVSVDVTTGDARLTDVNCKNLFSKGSTGDIELVGVIAHENFNIERSTGDVEFKNSDANEIFVTTSTGDIEGSLLSDKIFFAEADTGKVDVPKTTTGGKCELTTSTGDIEIRIG